MTAGSPADAYVIEPLGKGHDRGRFSCGKPPLDRYIREQATQEAKRYVAATMVAVPRGTPLVVGYYSLSTANVDAGDLPAEFVRRLPRYPRLPATLLARLAVDQNHKGRGLGEFLLIHALSRSLTLTEQAGSIAVIVDAIDEEARAFYEHYEFEPLHDQPLRLWLPTESIVSRLRQSR